VNFYNAIRKTLARSLRLLKHEPLTVHTTTIVNAPVNAPSAFLNDNDLNLTLHNDYASVVGSALTGIIQ